MNGGFGMPLARMGNWDALVSRFQGEYSHSLAGRIVADFLILSILAVLFTSLTYLIWRQLRERRANLPQGLFAELCAAHGLSKAEQRLLRRLAKRQTLTDPLPLFIEPRYFETCDKFADLRDQKALLAQLRQRLFH